MASWSWLKLLHGTADEIKHVLTRVTNHELLLLHFGGSVLWLRQAMKSVLQPMKEALPPPKVDYADFIIDQPWYAIIQNDYHIDNFVEVTGLVSE